MLPNSYNHEPLFNKQLKCCSAAKSSVILSKELTQQDDHTEIHQDADGHNGNNGGMMHIRHIYTHLLGRKSPVKSEYYG